MFRTKVAIMQQVITDARKCYLLLRIQKIRCRVEEPSVYCSDSSEGEEEVRGGVGKATNLMEGAAPWNKDMMVDKLLKGNYGKEDKIADSHKEWYKKTDWCETAIAGCEQRAIRRS
jgi:hypothetical protein